MTGMQEITLVGQEYSYSAKSNFIYIYNMSDEAIYVGSSPSVTTDNAVIIPAGKIKSYLNNTGDIYIIGNGKIQITESNDILQSSVFDTKQRLNSGSIKEYLLNQKNDCDVFCSTAVTDLPLTNESWFVTSERPEGTSILVHATSDTNGYTYRCVYNADTSTWTNWKRCSDGGDANTFDGFESTAFLKSYTGLYNYRLTTSINDYSIASGTYSCEAQYTPDYPTGYGSYGLLDIRKYGSIVYQTMKFETGIIINRACVQGQIDWTEWICIAASSYIDTYTDPSQLGLTSACTSAELYQAMPAGSIFIYPANNLSSADWNFPNASANRYTLSIMKFNNDRPALILLYPKVNRNPIYYTHPNDSGVLDSPVWIPLNGDISNPNILYNTNFKNPINQRGQTTYTGPGVTIDGWKLARVDNQITLTENGIKIGYVSDSTPSGTAHFFQIIENYQDYVGKTLSASVDVIETTSLKPVMMIVYTLDGVNTNAAITKLAAGRNTITGVIPEGITYLALWIYGADIRQSGETVGAYTIIDKPKLEEGPYSTKWLTPKPTDELLSCQRYLHIIQKAGSNFGTGYIASNKVYLMIPLPTTMYNIAVTPTVSISGIISIFIPNNGVNKSYSFTEEQYTIDAVVMSEHNICIGIYLPTDHGITSDLPCIGVLKSGGNGRISISKEL